MPSSHIPFWGYYIFNLLIENYNELECFKWKLLKLNFNKIEMELKISQLIPEILRTHVLERWMQNDN